MSGFRVGSGFDAHRLTVGRSLVLGGVTIPFDRGLEGHSDGDCLIHAICDALLGAAAAGDMGQHFPSSDPRFKDATSRSFLERVAAIVAEHGYTVENIDATVIAQAPALAPHLGAIRERLAELLALDTGAVSVKAKSSDGLGAIGRNEGIAAHAVALVRARE